MYFRGEFRMNKKGLFCFALLAGAIFALAGCASYTPEELKKDGWTQVTGDEVKSLRPFTGYGKSERTGNDFMLFVDENGNSRLSANSGKFKDSGKMEIMDDNSLCFQWKKIRKGKRGCFTYWKKGENYRTVKSDNTLSSNWTLKSGNPENL